MNFFNWISLLQRMIPLNRNISICCDASIKNRKLLRQVAVMNGYGNWIVYYDGHVSNRMQFKKYPISWLTFHWCSQNFFNLNNKKRAHTKLLRFDHEITQQRKNINKFIWTFWTTYWIMFLLLFVYTIRNRRIIESEHKFSWKKAFS